jgi:hypothetical protein
VRASTKIQLARWPALVQIFWPLMIHSSPSSSARHPRLPRSLPAFGSADDARQVVRLLLGGAPLQDGVADHLDAEHVVVAADGHARLVELLDQHDLLEGGEPGAAELGGPRRGEQPVVGQGRAPLLAERLGLGGGQRTDALPPGRQVLGEERLHLLAVGLGFGGVGGFHPAEGSGPPGGAATPARPGGSRRD